MDIEISQDNFKAEVLESEKPVLVDFWAEWCGPCNMLHPILEELERNMGSTIKFCKLNVDDNSVIASQYAISAIPTLILFQNGEIVERLIGFQTKSILEKILSKYAST